LRFSEDVRGAFIGNSENKGACVCASGLLLAGEENGGAGSVGDGKSVAKIFFTRSEGVEWEEMERSVRHDDEALAGTELAERRDQFDIEGFEVALRGAEERLFKFADVFTAHAEFGELEAEQLEDMGDPRKNGHGKNAYIAAVDDGGEETVAGAKIFEEGGVRGQSGLELLERKVGGSFQSGVFAFSRRKLA